MRRNVYRGTDRLWSRTERARVPQAMITALRREDRQDWFSVPAIVIGIVALIHGLLAALGLYGMLFGLALFLVFCGAMIIVDGMTLSTCRPSVLRDRFLRAGRCPSCTNMLPRERAEDGCAECRVCSAAWRLTPANTGACMYCQYAIGDLSREACGCTRCPECGRFTPDDPKLGCPKSQWRPAAFDGCESRV